MKGPTQSYTMCQWQGWERSQARGSCLSTQHAAPPPTLPALPHFLRPMQLSQRR